MLSPKSSERCFFFFFLNKKKGLLSRKVEKVLELGCCFFFKDFKI